MLHAHMLAVCMQVSPINYWCPSWQYLPTVLDHPALLHDDGEGPAPACRPRAKYVSDVNNGKMYLAFYTIM
jgi:hypothetical protein